MAGDPESPQVKRDTSEGYIVPIPFREQEEGSDALKKVTG